MLINSFCGVNLDNLTERDFNIESFINWCRDTSVGKNAPALGSDSVAEQRLRDLFALLDLNCDQSVSVAEMRNALNSLYYTLPEDSRGVDFDVDDINRLSVGLINLTKRTFMGVVIYKLFSASGGDFGNGDYYKLTKDEFIKAVNKLVPTTDSTTSWFESVSVLGVRISVSDAENMIFDILNSSSSVTTEGADTLSIEELGGIFNSILSKFVLSEAELARLSAAQRAVAEQENLSIRLKLFGGNTDSWQSIQERISEQSVRNAIALAFEPVIKDIFRKLIDAMEEAGEEMRRAIEGK